jgi:hypothetical protein
VYLVTDPVQTLGTTYHVAKNGNDVWPGTLAQPFLTITKALSVLNGGTVLIHVGTYNEQISSVRVGIATNWNIVKNYPGDAIIVDGTGKSTGGGLFRITHSYFDLEGIEVRNSPNGGGVRVEGNASLHHVYIQLVKAHDTYEVPICVSVPNNGSTKPHHMLVNLCEAHHGTLGGTGETISICGIDTFEVCYNYVHNSGGYPTYEHDKEGIDCKVGCTNGVIHHNDVSYAIVGIYLDAYGVDMVNLSVFNNYVHDMVDSAGHPGTGISIRSETGNTTVGSNIQVYNNIIARCGYGIDSMTDGHFTLTLLLINNTFYNNGTDFTVKMFPTNMTYSGCVARNNIVVANGGYIDLMNVPAAGWTVDYNLYFNPAAGGYGGTNNFGSNYIQADPKFVNAGARDFSLQSTSLAIDHGSPTLAPSIDYTGMARPYGAGFDIGAYEHALGIVLVATDGTKVGDNPKANLRFAKILTEGLKVGDNPFRYYVAKPLNRDGVKLSDSALLASTIHKMLTQDGVKVGDSTQTKVSFAILASDRVILSDITDWGLATRIFNLLTKDGIKVSDQSSIIVKFFNLLTDSLKLSDSTTWRFATGLSASDGLKLGDTLSLSRKTYPNLTDGVKLSDSDLSKLIFGKTVTDRVILSDYPYSAITIIVSDGAKLSDMASTLAVLQALRNDGVKLADIATYELAAVGLVVEITIKSQGQSVKIIFNQSDAYPRFNDKFVKVISNEKNLVLSN